MKLLFGVALLAVGAAICASGYDDPRVPVFVGLEFPEHKLFVYLKGERDPNVLRFEGNGLIHSIAYPARQIVTIKGTGIVKFRSAIFKIDTKGVSFNGHELSPKHLTFIVNPDLSLLEGTFMPFEKQSLKKK